MSAIPFTRPTVIGCSKIESVAIEHERATLLAFIAREKRAIQ
jgi:hypothetical protein